MLESGPYDLRFDRTNAALIKISSSSAQAINIERRIDQRANAAYSLIALKRSIEASNPAGSAAFNFSYAVSGSFPALGSTRFQVDTPQNLALQAGSGALIGAVKVVGAGGGSLVLTFLGDNADSVRLDLDANGDGTIDQTQTRSVDELVTLVLAAQ